MGWTARLISSHPASRRTRLANADELFRYQTSPIACRAALEIWARSERRSNREPPAAASPKMVRIDMAVAICAYPITVTPRLFLKKRIAGFIGWLRLVSSGDEARALIVNRW